MNTQTFLTVIQITISILLILTILSQVQGSGLSLIFGGGGGFYRSKRGIEKLLFYATIVLSICFTTNAIILFVI